MLLDFEGEEGTNPAEDYRGSNLTNSQRRVAVAKFFPRLAFASADVLVFIDRNPFANSQFLERTLKFARQATNGIVINEKPSLLLIQNQCMDQGIQDQNDHLTQTKGFRGAHQEEDFFTEFSSHYQEIQMFRLPHKLLKSDKTGGCLYDEKLLQLKKLLSRMINKKQKSRLDLGQVYPPDTWWKLFKHICVNINLGTLRISEIIRESLLPKSSFINSAIEAVRKRFTGTNDLEYVSWVWSYLYVQHYRIKERKLGLTTAEKYLLINLKTTKKSDEYKSAAVERQEKAAKTCKAFGRQMLSLILADQQCEAVYYLKEKGEKKHKVSYVRCTEKANGHRDVHICEDYDKTHYLFEGKITKATGWKQFSTLFKVKKPQVVGGWPGLMQWAPLSLSPEDIRLRIKHQDDASSSEKSEGKDGGIVTAGSNRQVDYDIKRVQYEIVSQFPSKVEKLISLSTEGLAAAAYAIARLKVRGHPKDGQCNYCLIKQEDMSMQCGHWMCTDCYRTYAKFDIVFNEIEPEALSIDGLGEPLSSVSFKTCPFHDSSGINFTGDFRDYQMSPRK